MIEILAQTATNAPSSGFESIGNFFRHGGIFMIPLAITSIAGLMAIMYKFLSLSRNRVIPAELARDVAAFDQRIAAGQTEPVLREFQEGKSALARLGAVVIKHRGKPQPEITPVVEAAAREETMHLHAGVGVLDIVITVAPLLGLLGTASGLVVIFQGLGETTDHLAIARGISEALSTTIFGLAIAVPCVVAHGYFSRKIEAHTARLEILLTDLVSVCQKPNPNA
jgi:biopolymer transport protein ExbB